jgi:transcriptional regulator GlxA family with amidase domain
LAEPLTLARVARVAGFAPDYFSRLFKRDEGMTFTSYVQEARVDRALSARVQGQSQEDSVAISRTGRGLSSALESRPSGIQALTCDAARRSYRAER